MNGAAASTVEAAGFGKSPSRKRRSQSMGVAADFMLENDDQENRDLSPRSELEALFIRSQFARKSDVFYAYAEKARRSVVRAKTVLCSSCIS